VGLSVLKKVPGTQRVIPAEETIERVYPAARSLGVTRLADITGLDRVGVPTYSAMVPRSKDGLSVSTGKGLRPAEAKAGALMEAIERQTAISTRPPLIQGSFEELRRQFPILDPRDTKELLLEDYDSSRNYFWVRGVDLVSDSSILVPAHMAGLVWDDVPGGPFRDHLTSNGLSSGNVREEAICQGLCELIERDAWTLADLGAHLIPWARRQMLDPATADHGPDDFELFPSLTSVGSPAAQQFEAAGLSPIVHDITSDIGIPTIFAVVPDEGLPGFPMVHGGVGTHPDVRVAVTRALTEAAQSRCVDIQGVREDLMPPGFESTALSLHTRRVVGINRNLWFLGESKEPRSLSRIPSTSFDDVRLELDYIVARLLLRKISRIIVVDLSPPNAPFAVVRVIVPDLESASVTRGRLGYRAMQFWRKNAQAGHLPGSQP
jgi:ribosomal protein S12 methylthiotransferase accessory factor